MNKRQKKKAFKKKYGFNPPKKQNVSVSLNELKNALVKLSKVCSEAFEKMGEALITLSKNIR